MSTCKQVIRLNKRIVAEMAWSKAVREGKSFTADELANWCCMTANRHFRAYLNSLVSLKLLNLSRKLCTDGHWRKFYYADFDAMKARFTKTLPNFEIVGEKVS